MKFGPTPPLVSEEIEKPEPIAWLYETADRRREALVFKTPDAQLEEYRLKCQQIYESELFGLGSLESYAQNAVQAEQDRILPFVEECANILTPHRDGDDDCARLANQVLHELAQLRRLVSRGSGSGERGGEKEPLWWWTESDIEAWSLSRRMFFR